VGVDKKRVQLRVYQNELVIIFACLPLYSLFFPHPLPKPSCTFCVLYFFRKSFSLFRHTYNDFVAVSVFWQPTKATSKWVAGRYEGGRKVGKSMRRQLVMEVWIYILIEVWTRWRRRRRRRWDS